MRRKFDCYSDPGHGWMKVPFETLRELGLSANDFSVCSYLGKGHIYLEEDGDATKFCEAYKKANGYYPSYRHHSTYDRRSKIRSKPANSQSAQTYFGAP